MRSEHAHVPYTPAQVFDLVADCESYPKFLPGVMGARIIRRDAHTLWADMTMGTRFLTRSFITVARLERPHRIVITSDDPMFERFEQTWTFKPAGHGGTEVEYRADFKFRSRLLQGLVGAVFADRAADAIHAFRHRARAVYGAS